MRVNSYWGGAVAALGGALLVGAIPRLRSRPSVAAGILSGLGLAILANSRPFEGLVLALPLLVGVLLMAVRMPAGKRNKLVLHAGLAAGITVAVCGFAMAYYNTVGAGDPLRMPYQVNRDEYGVAPYFVFQSPSPEPLYRHKELRDFYAVAEMGFYQDTQSAKQMLIHRLRQTLRLWNFYGGAAFSIALLTLPATLRDRRIRLLVLTLGVFLLCISFEVWVMPHYVAPALAAFWILLIQTLRHLWVWRENGKRTGRFFVAVVPVVLVLTVVCCLSEGPLLGKSSGPFPHMARCCSTLDDTSMHDRARIEHALKADGGRHLIVVHYSERHNVDQEWVYNRANIDQEQVVWAREMSSPENENLLRYFEGRKVWLLDADAESPAVVPYPGAGTN